MSDPSLSDIDIKNNMVESEQPLNIKLDTFQRTSSYEG